MEENYSPYLTNEEKEDLFKHPHTNSYILSQQELDHLNEHGYVVVKCFEEEDCDRVVSEIYATANKYWGLDKNDKSTWKNISKTGFINLWHLPTLYRMRQNEKLYSIFSQLLKTHKLSASIDRVSLKPPCTDPEVLNKNSDPNENLPLHTDINYWHSSPLTTQFQCGVCIIDCDADCGGFYCIPGFQKRDKIVDYMNSVQQGKFEDKEVPLKSCTFCRFADKETARLNKVTVPLKKGEVVIWNNNLPHSGGINCNPNKWRVQAFVRFLPLDGPCLDYETKDRTKHYVNSMIVSMKKGMRPTKYPTLNKVSGSFYEKGIEVPDYQYPELSDLGRKLFGVVEWED